MGGRGDTPSPSSMGDGKGRYPFPLLYRMTSWGYTSPLSDDIMERGADDVMERDTQYPLPLSDNVMLGDTPPKRHR